jgi:hypothetical protein
MRTLFCAVLTFGCLLGGSASAEYVLLCLHDLPGNSERRYDSVRIDGAKTLAEACAAVADDPQFGDYNWRSCVAPSGRGTCGQPQASASRTVVAQGQGMSPGQYPPGVPGVPVGQYPPRVPPNPLPPAASTPLPAGQDPGVMPPNPPYGPDRPR